MENSRRKIVVLSFSLGLLLGLATQRDQLGLSSVKVVPPSYSFTLSPEMRTLSNFLGGTPEARIGEVSDADLEAARLRNHQVLAQANRAVSDLLPGAITPQYLQSLHQFDPNLGNPFVTNQWANWGKLTPLSMNTYANGTFRSLDPFRAESAYDFSTVAAPPRTTTIQLVM